MDATHAFCWRGAYIVAMQRGAYSRPMSNVDPRVAVPIRYDTILYDTYDTSSFLHHSHENINPFVLLVLHSLSFKWNNNSNTLYTVQ